MSEPNARFITSAWLGANQVELKSHWVLLQADTPGTCRLIVKQKAARLTPVALDLGWGEMVDRVFLATLTGSSQSWAVGLHCFAASCRPFWPIILA